MQGEVPQGGMYRACETVHRIALHDENSFHVQ